MRITLLLICVLSIFHAQGQCISVELRSQAAVNNFSCATTRILYIAGSDITDLSPLANASSIESLVIVNCPNLTSLTGLEGVPITRGFDISICPGLTSLQELQGATDLDNIRLSNNINLPSIDLPNLSSLESLFIQNNGVQSLSGVENIEALRSLGFFEYDGSFQGLENLKTIEFDLTLFECEISSLVGLDNLETIGRKLFITDQIGVNPLPGLNKLQSISTLEIVNSGLTSLDNFLSGLTDVQTVIIKNNPNLSDCSNISEILCTAEVVDISGNAGNCASLSAITPKATWYLDLDLDGYGDLSNPTEACGFSEGISRNSEDCDDTNAQINPQSTWYIDMDDDGFGSTDMTLVQCLQPDGYVLNSGDCDDNDPSLSTVNTWYLDSDSDGFGDPEIPLAQCSQPDGYVDNDGDCDDTDRFINPDNTWYPDTDEDGYGDATGGTQQCEQPEGYIDNNLDCNDQDFEVNPDTQWYEDEDGDGYGNSGNPRTQCTQPPGFVLNGQDCNDSDQLLNPETPWFRDLDDDGFGDPNDELVQCEQPFGYIRNEGDCDDTDPNIVECPLGFEDLKKVSVLYPNPVKSGFNLQIKGIYDEIMVYDLTGKQYVLKNGLTKDPTVNQSFSPGVYIVVLKKDNKTFLNKLLVY